MSKPPNKIWFPYSERNVAEFMRRYPGARDHYGRDLIDYLSHATDARVEVGCSHDEERHYFGWVSTPGWYAKEGYTELDLTPEPACATFPDNHYFLNTPENIQAFLKEFPNTPGSDGGNVTSSYFTYMKSARQFEFSLGWLSASSSPPGATLKRYYFEHEKRGSAPAVAEHAAATPKKGDVDNLARKTFDGTAWIDHKDIVNEPSIPPPATGWSGALTASLNNTYNSLLYSKLPFSTVFTQPKEPTMALSDQEMNTLATKVAAQLRATPEKVAQRGVIAKARGLAWTGTKRSLAYCFAPAARWAQNIIFIASIAGLGYGGYKSYNWFNENVSLPTITWEQPQDASPSDVK